MEDDQLRLRLLLWSAYNDGTGYGDDGELQLWGIDFKRSSVSEIEGAIIDRRLTMLRMEALPLPPEISGKI